MDKPTLNEIMERARRAQILHRQRHDVQLDLTIADIEEEERWIEHTQERMSGEIPSGLMYEFPDTSYHADATKEDRA